MKRFLNFYQAGYIKIEETIEAPGWAFLHRDCCSENLAAVSTFKRPTYPLLSWA